MMEEQESHTNALHLAFDVMARRKWLVVLTFVGALTAGISTVTFLPEVYSSAATVLIERQQIPEELVRATVTSSLEVRLHTISQEILSRSRLEGLINRFGLYTELQEKEEPMEVIIERMRKDISLGLRGSERRRDERTVQDVLIPPIESKRFVFVIDVSKSMHIKDPVRGGERARKTSGGKGTRGDCDVCGGTHRGIGLDDSRMRVERVKRELVRIVRKLDKDVRFNILAFSTDVTPWGKADDLIQATEANKRKAIEFVKALTYDAFTSTDYALERAFDHQEANAIYLLSDGTPLRDGEHLPKKPILEMVAYKNRLRKVKIFTFGFSNDADWAFLRRLSEENGGTFTPVH